MGKPARSLDNHPSSVIPPQTEKSPHIQVNLSLNLFTSEKSIASPKSCAAICTLSVKKCKIIFFDPICSRTSRLHLTWWACNGTPGSGDRACTEEPHPGAHQPTATLGQSSQNGLGTTSKQAAQGGQNLNIKIRFARLSRHQERDGRPQKTAILNYTHTPREREAQISRSPHGAP